MQLQSTPSPAVVEVVIGLTRCMLPLLRIKRDKLLKAALCVNHRRQWALPRRRQDVAIAPTKPAEWGSTVPRQARKQVRCWVDLLHGQKLEHHPLQGKPKFVFASPVRQWP